MSKRPDPESYKSLDTMLPQGIRSRFDRALKLIDQGDELLPEHELGGTPAEIKQAIKHYTEATHYLTEMLVYRQIYGVD